MIAQTGELLLTGYAHPGYIESLSEFGTPYPLQHSGGWLLIRDIPGTPYQDAMGAYPLFACREWSLLPLDLNTLPPELVSVALVVDPLAEVDRDTLRQCFPDVLLPFKKHFVVNFLKPLEKTVSSHHRYYARKALRNMTVDRPVEPATVLEDWYHLYTGLIRRHNICGIKAFSKTAFQKQLLLPGMVVFRAVQGTEILGMQLWLQAEDRVYHHLSAYSDSGYRKRASYALLWSSLRYFQEAGFRQADLGGGAGIHQPEDGLTEFKKGWATETRTTYFCGRILNHQRYQQLVRITETQSLLYFPAYRHGEMIERKES